MNYPIIRLKRKHWWIHQLCHQDIYCVLILEELVTGSKDPKKSVIDVDYRMSTNLYASLSMTRQCSAFGERCDLSSAFLACVGGPWGPGYEEGGGLGVASDGRYTIGGA